MVGRWRLFPGSRVFALAFSGFAASATGQAANPLSRAHCHRQKSALFQGYYGHHTALIARNCLTHGRAEKLKDNRGSNKETEKDRSHPGRTDRRCQG